MIKEHFRTSISNVAYGEANDGLGKLALMPSMHTEPPLLRLGCRDTTHRIGSEQSMLSYISNVITSAGYGFSHNLVVSYYVSLKSNPFVILTGAMGHGKTEFIQLFAQGLLGQNAAQYALISSTTSWHEAASTSNYYRSLQERFSSLRFLELLQDATHPGNAGKIYLVCFDGLSPHELDYYFGNMLHITSQGEKILNLPGGKLDELPRIPSNVYITATVNESEQDTMFSSEVLRSAGLIEFRGPINVTDVPATPTIKVPPPTGFQRIWQRSAIRDVPTAKQRLIDILGAQTVSQLRCSTELARLLWRGGIVLSKHTLQELTVYIANSFDEDGIGLFNPNDVCVNAQIAYDAQVVQRVLWRLHNSEDSDLRADLARYLDGLSFQNDHLAVA